VWVILRIRIIDLNNTMLMLFISAVVMVIDISVNCLFELYYFPVGGSLFIHARPRNFNMAFAFSVTTTRSKTKPWLFIEE